MREAAGGVEEEGGSVGEGAVDGLCWRLGLVKRFGRWGLLYPLLQAAPSVAPLLP